MTTEKAELSIEEGARQDLKLLDDPFVRAEQLDRAGFYLGPPLPLGKIWNDIGGNITDQQVKEWENQEQRRR